MNVRVNGEPRVLADAAPLSELLAALDVAPSTRGVAVAVDEEVVPRAAWAEHRLAEGARVEVLHAVQGG